MGNIELLPRNNVGLFVKTFDTSLSPLTIFIIWEVKNTRGFLGICYISFIGILFYQSYTVNVFKGYFNFLSLEGSLSLVRYWLLNYKYFTKLLMTRHNKAALLFYEQFLLGRHWRDKGL